MKNDIREEAARILELASKATPERRAVAPDMADLIRRLVEALDEAERASHYTAQLEEEVTKLTQSWNSLIVGTPHKDDDYHFGIIRHWSYGNKPSYSVEHCGYILRDFTVAADSYDDALAKLKEILKRGIEDGVDRP